MAKDLILTDTPALAFAPRLAIDSRDHVHVVWYDSRSGNDQVYYTQLNPEGKTLVPDTLISSGASIARWPVVAVDSHDHVHIAWEDPRDHTRPIRTEIYYSHRNPDGQPVAPDARLTNNRPRSARPELIVDAEDHLHLAWMQKELADIHYRMYTNTAPAFVGTPPTHYRPGSSFRHQLQATDPDLNPVTYTLEAGPHGMQIDAESGELTWVPAGPRPRGRLDSLRPPRGEPVLVTVAASDGFRTTRRTFALTPGGSR